MRFGLLVLVVGCSDYNLDGAPDHAGEKPPLEETTTGPSTDSATTSTDTEDSATGTVPSVDTAAPEGKIDVVLLIDEAYFYDCYHADLPRRSTELIDLLLGSGADVAIAVATFDDYQVTDAWYAGDNGLPYALTQQLTTDAGRLHNAASGLSLAWGGDWQGSGYEAIAQAARGRGFDQDCNGRYDAATDVKPFTASASDAFGGAAADSSDSSVPGTGTIQGVGFRTDSARVIVVFAENGFRSAALGHPMPTGTCPGPASASSAASEMDAAKAKFLGVNSYEFQDIDPTLQGQLEELATLTDSRYDANGDGNPDELAVLAGSWDWPDANRVVAAIWDLAGS